MALRTSEQAWKILISVVCSFALGTKKTGADKTIFFLMKSPLELYNHLAEEFVH